MLGLVWRLLRDEGGGTAIEYGLVVVLVSLAAIALYPILGSSLNEFFFYVDGWLVVAAGS